MNGLSVEKAERLASGGCGSVKSIKEGAEKMFHIVKHGKKTPAGQASGEIS